MPVALLSELLNIASPTFKEDACRSFIEQWLDANVPECVIHKVNNSLLVEMNAKNDGPTIALVGHIDTVPDFFKPYTLDDQLFGSGASDMKGGVAAFLTLYKQNTQWKNVNLTLIIYDREEGTALSDNGLFHAIRSFPDFFNDVDLAIVGEPTDGAVQVGCLGSLHANITVKGKACHSARPWQGKNALYEALPLVSYFSDLEPVTDTIFGVDFKTVFQITESQSERGRTSVPGEWRANINMRFSPSIEPDQAVDMLNQHIVRSGVKDCNLSIADIADAGTVIENELFSSVVQLIGGQTEAKQAWTDVAQLSKLGIPAFNYGPGLQAQAHQANEYILLSDLEDYTRNLVRALQTLNESL